MNDARTYRQTPSAPSGPGDAPKEDLGLVQALLAGDEAAFAVLTERYHAKLVRLALAYVPDRATAEEVAQETWLGVLHGLSTFEGRSTLKTWIFRILTNRAKTRGTREARSVPFSALEDPEARDEAAVDPSRFKPNGMWSEPPQQWDEATPEKLLLQREAMRFLEKAIEQLPPNQRAVVLLRDVEGLDAEEVCNILQLGETNQRVLLHRGRSKLRAALGQYMGKK